MAAERTHTLPGLSQLPPLSLQLREPVWGIDPSTQRHAVGILVPGHPTIVRWETLSLPLKRNARNAADWYASQFRAIHPFLQQLVAEFGEPARVDVEEPFAKGKQHVHPSSNRTLGVLLAALGFSLGCPVELVQPNTWKAGSMGAGWGTCTPAQYLEWAQENAGYTGTLEDEAAGILIATAAGVKEVACGVA